MGLQERVGIRDYNIYLHSIIFLNRTIITRDDCSLLLLLM